MALWIKNKTLTAAALLIALASPIFAVAQTPQGPTRAALYASQSAAAAEELAAATANAFATAAAAGIPAPLIVADIGLRSQIVLQQQLEVNKAVAKVAEVQNGIFEDVLGVLEKVLYENLKKKILDMVVDQIIGYIQGEGDPKFITDWQGFFGDIAQGAVGDLTQALGLGFLCSPFSLPVRLQISASLAAPVDRFKAKFNCTLDQIVGNIENFYTDFRNGGWKAYDVAWEPQNNYYGAIWLAWDEQQNIIANRLVSAANEAIANQGWLGVRKCYDPSGNEVDSNFAYTGATGVNCTIVTPGKALGDLASKAIGADIDFIVNSNDLSTYIASITNALINRIFKEGVGLLGVVTPSAPQRNVSVSTDVRNALGQYQGTTGTTRASMKQQLELVRDAYIAAGASLSQRLNLENNYLSQLRVLQNCETKKRVASAATTEKINSQTAVISALQARIADNQSILNQYNFSIRELDTLTEAQVTANLGHYQNLTAQYADALQLKQTTANELATASNTIPGLVSTVNTQIEECNRTN